MRRGQACGQDLRDRVLAADGSIREVARRFAVSESYVARARSRQQRGQLSAGLQCNHVPLWLQGLGGALTERVATPLEQTLAQLYQWVEVKLREHSGHGLWASMAPHVNRQQALIKDLINNFMTQ
ncbi:hypothetical protein SAMN04244572_02738 [Azotobacter beijerinckii]|uniref:Uncharacterized protein n=1 Tax=Azotobacter beijerinckii TaxID=170623 RepID=A0A1I4EQH4_9GAMM|nr:hypothetical protein SAMN04244572_02738 [Azotobacter beijerinckii]SFB57387.1 hypothetical protein SAMN04244571_03933 [Azotobacter beijerinckii]SFL07340.1 hypothetical protein SAMN04244574_03011 [Azotobacter beijerinckii]